MTDQLDIKEALLTAVTGELERERDYFPSSAAVARQQAKADREAAMFRRRLIRFLGEMPEGWTVIELLGALENDREPEVGEEDGWND